MAGKNATSFEIDPASLRSFKKALQKYKEATGKDEADILNRASYNVMLRAMSFTPKARLSRFPFNAKPNKGTRYRERFFFAKLARHGRKGTPYQEAEKAHKAKRSSSGYIRAGWLNAAHEFAAAAKKRPPRFRPFRRGDAARGGAKRARQGFRVEAEATNYADGADSVGSGPLRMAMDFVAVDMEDWAQAQLNKTARKYSAKDIRSAVTGG